MTHLSRLFRHISHFRHAGHQIGRKVGDMLEVLTYAALVADEQLGPRLQIEPRLYGFTDAGHKVEFAVLNEPGFKKGGEIKDPSNMIGFIECKKVGVEQTICGAFKKKHGRSRYVFGAGDILSMTLGKKGGDNKYSFDVYFESLLDEKLGIKVVMRKNKVPSVVLQEEIADSHRIIFALTSDGHAVVYDNSKSLRDIDPLVKLDKCKILEIKSVANGKATILLNDCLTGPQTPEKAKQSAFVALDVRKLRFKQFDKRPNEKEMVSVLVLTEFSHWEQKSQNVVLACLDKVVVVDDEIVIEAFKEFALQFKPEEIYEKISKDNFEKDEDVRRIALKIVKQHHGLIFRDLDDDQMKRFELSHGALCLTTTKLPVPKEAIELLVA